MWFVLYIAGLGMLWFIIWMLLIADEPSRDSGMSDDEKRYINTSLTSSLTSSSPHHRRRHHEQQPFNVQQQVTLLTCSLH